MPLPDPPQHDPATRMSFTELSELDARALCAKLDIPIFWHRTDQGRKKW